MAIIPVNPEAPAAVTTGGLGVPAGGGIGFVSSGTCSGTAFEHNQTLAIHYTWANASELDGAWLPGCNTVSGFKCQAAVGCYDMKYPFVTSGNANGTCSGAFNMLQRQEIVFSASVLWGGEAGGTGETGVIYTVSAGIQRMRARTSDIEQIDDRYYPNLWFPIFGGTAYLTNNTWAKQFFVRPIVVAMTTGGLEYNPTGNSQNTQITGSMPLLDQSLIYI